jgi:hypothetical protein
MLRLVQHILVALIDWLSPRTRLTAENMLLRQQRIILRRTTTELDTTSWPADATAG